MGYDIKWGVCERVWVSRCSGSAASDAESLALAPPVTRTSPGAPDRILILLVVSGPGPGGLRVTRADPREPRQLRADPREPRQSRARASECGRGATAPGLKRAAQAVQLVSFSSAARWPARSRGRKNTDIRIILYSRLPELVKLQSLVNERPTPDQPPNDRWACSL